MNRGVSPTSSYYRQKVAELKPVLAVIRYADFVELPSYIKDDLVAWFTRKEEKAMVRLYRRGMRIKQYREGKGPLFPGGVVGGKPSYGGRKTR